MRRDDDARAEPRDLFEHGLGEGRPLGRIRPGHDLVEQDDAVAARLPAGREDVAKHGDMARERRQRSLDRLLVADVGEDRLDEGDARAGSACDLQSRANHQAGEPDGLEQHGLAAGVRPRDDDAKRGMLEHDVVGDDHGRRRFAGRAAEQQQHRMREAAQFERNVEANLRRRRVQVAAEPCPRGREIDGAMLGERDLQLGGMTTDGGRQLAKDPLALLLDVESHGSQVVVELDQLGRLDEQGVSRSGSTMEDPGHARATIGSHGKHVAIVADGDVVVGQRPGHVRITAQGIEPGLDVSGERSLPAMQVLEFPARVVPEAPMLIDGTVNRTHEIRQARDPARTLGQ